MKHKIFLKKYDLVVMYQDYLTHLDVTHAAKAAGVVYSTASKAIKTLQGLMAGEKINRKKMATEFILAAEELKKPVVEETVIETQLIQHAVEVPPETPEAKVERLLEELKLALVDYAYEKAVTDVAKKSNIIGFLNARFQQ